MSETYIEFNYRIASEGTALGWRMNPVYDKSNPRWKDEIDKKPILGGRKQGEDGFPGSKPRSQAFVDKYWHPETGKCKGALVGIVLPYNISLDGDRHPNAQGIIEHDGVAALQRIIDKYGADISGAIRGTTPGKGTPETQGVRLIFQRSAEVGNQLDTSEMDPGNRPGKLPKGIDVQSGEGAHVIGPCRRYDGREWTWDRLVGPGDLARLPSTISDIRSGLIKLDDQEAERASSPQPEETQHSNASVPPPPPKVSLTRSKANAPGAAAITSTPPLSGSVSPDWFTTVGDMKAAQIGLDRELNGDPVTGAIGLAQEPEGGRGKRSNAISFRAGRLLERGLLPNQADIEQLIYAATWTNGLVAKDGAQTVADNIRRAIADGREREREEREAKELRAFMAEQWAGLAISAAPFAQTPSPETIYWLALADRAIDGLHSRSTQAEYTAIAHRVSPGVRLGVYTTEYIVGRIMEPAYLYGISGVTDLDQFRNALTHIIDTLVHERTQEGLTRINSDSDWKVSLSWLFKGLLPSLGVGAYIGEPGTGKTTHSLELTRVLAIGGAYSGIEPSMRGGTLILTGENIDSMRARIAVLKLNIATGKPYHRPAD